MAATFSQFTTSFSSVSQFFSVCPVTHDACQFCCVQDQVLWALPPPNKVNDAVFIPPCTPNDDDSQWQGP